MFIFNLSSFRLWIESASLSLACNTGLTSANFKIHKFTFPLTSFIYFNHIILFGFWLMSIRKNIRRSRVENPANEVEGEIKWHYSKWNHSYNKVELSVKIYIWNKYLSVSRNIKKFPCNFHIKVSSKLTRAHYT